jgi:hypothetical protein
MGKLTGRDYQAMLDQAGDELEREVDDQLLQDLIDQRLNALGAGPQDVGEAEAAAAAAQAPRTRVDGQPMGSDTPRGRPLTPSMIRFAQGVIEGKSRRQSYRDAYPNAKGGDATISACAHRLSKDPRIKQMIQTGWDETAEELADDRAAQIRYVNRALVALSKTGKQEGTRLRALELLGRAAGMYREQQAEADKPLTAEQLRQELTGHLKLVSIAKPKASGVAQ